MARFGRGYAISPLIQAGATDETTLRSGAQAGVRDVVSITVPVARIGATASVYPPIVPQTVDVAPRIGATGDIRVPGIAALTGRSGATGGVRTAGTPVPAGRAGATASVRAPIGSVLAPRIAALADVRVPLPPPAAYIAFTPTYATPQKYATAARVTPMSADAIVSSASSSFAMSSYTTSVARSYVINAITQPTLAPAGRSQATTGARGPVVRVTANRAGATGGVRNPTTPVFGRDAFVGSADVLLTAHTPDIGGSWARHSSSVDSVELAGDGTIRVVTGTGFSTTYTIAANPPLGDYEVSADYNYASTATTIQTGVAARWATGATTGYLAVYNLATDAWTLFKIVAGSATTLASAPAGLTVGSAGRLKLRVSGTTTTALQVVVNGTPIINVTDTTSPITAANKAGVRLLNNSGSTAGMHLGGFYSGDPTPDPAPFSVSGTKILASDAISTFIGKGANIGVNSGIGGNTSSTGELTTPHTTEALAWGWNIIRLMGYVSRDTSWIGATTGSGTYGRQKAIDDMITVAQAYVNAGFVVILNVMDITSGNGVTTNDLPDIENAFTQWATHFATERRVWFNINEPDSGTVNSAAAFQSFHQRFYDAVRNAGNSSIYVADVMTNAQDSVFGTLPKAYDPTVGPAFLSGRSNVVFALHNYGGQGQNLYSQAQFTAVYQDYIDACRTAGLAMIIGESGFRPDGLDFAGGRTDTNRNVRGLYASLATAASRNLTVIPWHGTYDRFALKRAMVNSSNAQPFYYNGASANLSQMGRDYWQYTNGTFPTEETVTIAASVGAATESSAGQDTAAAPVVVTVAKPTCVTGDTLVAVLAQRGATSGWSVTAQTGWAELNHFDPLPRGSSARAWIQTRVVDGTEPSSLTWTFANQAGQCNVVVFVVKGRIRLPAVETIVNSTATTGQTGYTRQASVNGTVPVGVVISSMVSGSAPFTWSGGTSVIQSTSGTFTSNVQTVAVGKYSTIASGASSAPSGSFAGAAGSLMLTFLLEPSYD